MLERVRIINDAERLAAVMARAGEAPEVVLEATYGWYWAVDALRQQGARVHLAHPLGVKAFEYRRVKNDERDAARSGRSAADGPAAGGVDRAAGDPGAAGAGAAPGQAGRAAQPLQGRGPRGAGQVRGPGADERPVRPGGHRAAGPAGPAGAVCGPDRLAAPDDRLAWTSRSTCSPAWSGGRLARDPGYTAVQTIPGIGPILGAVFVAEIGDVTGSPGAEQLTCWAGLTPKHHESDTHVHRGRITKQGSRLVRWAAVESVQILPATSAVGRLRDRVADRRGRNIGVVAAARRQLEFVFYALRDHHVRALQRHQPSGGMTAVDPTLVGAGRAGHDPHRRGRPL